MHAQGPGFGHPLKKVSPGLSLRLFSPVYMYLVPLSGEKYFSDFHLGTWDQEGHSDRRSYYITYLYVLSMLLVTQSCPTICNPRTVARQAPLDMEFSRQEYWSGLPFPSPGDLPNPGIEPRSPALQADSLPSEPLGEPISNMLCN